LDLIVFPMFPVATIEWKQIKVIIE
jgi:hypothetical protein